MEEKSLMFITVNDGEYCQLGRFYYQLDDTFLDMSVLEFFFIEIIDAKD